MRVYIAGPYTQGDPVENVRRAIRAAERVIASGHHPYVPHLNHLWHLISPHSWEYWMTLDLAFLPACDCMIRLPGESVGADRETRAAAGLMPIYYSVEAWE